MSRWWMKPKNRFNSCIVIFIGVILAIDLFALNKLRQYGNVANVKNRLEYTLSCPFSDSKRTSPNGEKLRWATTKMCSNIYLTHSSAIYRPWMTLNGSRFNHHHSSSNFYSPKIGFRLKTASQEEKILYSLWIKCRFIFGYPEHCKLAEWAHWIFGSAVNLAKESRRFSAHLLLRKCFVIKRTWQSNNLCRWYKSIRAA